MPLCAQATSTEEGLGFVGVYDLSCKLLRGGVYRGLYRGLLQRLLRGMPGV